MCRLLPGNHGKKGLSRGINRVHEVTAISELRQNLASKEWVVISPDRGKKPNEILNEVTRRPVSQSPYESDCPFCPKNEDRFAIVERHKITDDNGNWAVKAIHNKYSIFAAFDNCPMLPGAFDQAGIYQKLKGCGSHEVVVETNRHNQAIFDLSSQEFEHVLCVYLDRYLAFKKNPNNLITMIFKNYGVLAGQTQPHSHSQIVGSRVVPLYIRSLLHEAEKHFDNFGTCVYCDMIRFETKEEIRIIDENEEYVAFVPFAADSEHETWIVPKWHSGGIACLQGKKAS